MTQRFRNGHLLNTIRVPRSEGPAGSGQDQPTDRFRCFAKDALPERTVLTIDREHLASKPMHGIDNEGAGNDQALLVCKRNISTSSQRRERCRQRATTTRRDKNNIDVGECGDGLQRRHATDDVNSLPTTRVDCLA